MISNLSCEAQDSNIVSNTIKICSYRRFASITEGLRQTTKQSALMKLAVWPWKSEAWNIIAVICKSTPFITALINNKNKNYNSIIAVYKLPPLSEFK